MKQSDNNQKENDINKILITIAFCQLETKQGNKDFYQRKNIIKL